MRFAISIMVFAFSSTILYAQSSSDQNAAVMYQRAIDQLNRFRESSPDVFHMLTEYGGDPDAPVTGEIRAALAQVQPILESARQGAALTSCEFPINREDGIEMMLPHLSQMRNIARFMKADAMVRYNDGDTTGAASTAADLYRISDHFSADTTIISSLVGNAVFALADNTVQHGIDRGVFGEAESQILQDGLQRLESLDPFDYGAAIAGEKESVGGWLKERAEEDEPGKIFAEISGMGAGELGEDDHPLLLMTKERFEHEIELYEEVMGRMVNIFNMPDRDAAKIAMKEMEDEIEAMQMSANHGGEGVLVGMMMPALGKAMEQRNRGEKMLSDRRAMLGALATGKASPRDFANAALWYVRAIELLESSPAATLDQLRELSNDTSMPMSPELQAALQGKVLQEAIDVFRNGSFNRRCDFSIARQQRILELLPKYVPGMHDGFRLLHADAVRLIRAGETERSLDQLTICVRMAGHLGSDPLMLSSLSAHCNFNKTVALLKSALSDGAVGDQFKPALAEALDRVEMGDPFGYVNSAVAARGDIANRLLWLSPGLETGEDRERRKTDIAESLHSLNADQTLHLLIVFDVMGENAMTAAESAHAAKGGSATPAATVTNCELKHNLMTRLSDVVSPAEFETAQGDSSRLAPLMYQGNLILLDGFMVPAVASSKWGRSLADHVRRAPSDVRSARSLVQSSSNKP